MLYVTGLGKLSKLQWLSLSGNNLATLDTGVLEKLSDLKYLSVENNCITYLRGLQVWILSLKYLVVFLSYEGRKGHKLFWLKINIVYILFYHASSPHVIIKF